MRGSEKQLRFLPEASLALISLATSLLVWTPFIGRMDTIYRHWDSPNDLTVARTLYRIGSDNPLVELLKQPLLDKETRQSFFASRLPMYPLFVRAFSWMGFEPALLFVSLTAGAIAVILFYRLARDVWQLSSPYYLSLVFLFLPPRWFLYRSVGSTESLYIVFTLASVLFFERQRFGRSAIFASMAALTRITGLMFIPAYGVLLIRRRATRALPWLLLIAGGFCAYGFFCAERFGDFFAYFRPHEDKISSLVPFAQIKWLIAVGLIHHAEFHILLAFVYAAGIVQLRKFPVIFWYCTFQWFLLVFIGTEDWSRYFLSMAPFALVVGYRELLEPKLVRWIFPVYVVISLYYAQAVIPKNLCPLDTYQRLLLYLGIR